MPVTSGSTPALVAGRYVVERVLGEGATAVVFLARDTTGGRMVAIKVLRPELADSSANSRFLKEIQRTAGLQHPHILQVLDSGEHDGRPYFVLPYMEGGTLRRRLKRENQLPIADAIAITRTVAAALDHAHARGLIHRDVKPENILFTGGEACLGDFGIARALENVYGKETSSTSANIVRGTPAYMSPEQASGGGGLDGRSDIYSLACVFYEMITGMQAFMGPTPESVIAMRFAHPPREMRVFRPSAPGELEPVLAKALSLQAADRFSTASEFVAALQSAIESRSTAELEGNAAVTRAMRLPVAVAVVIAVVAFGIGWRVWRSSPLVESRYAVLPFVVHGTSTLDGTSLSTLMYDELRRWPDLERVDPLRLNTHLVKAGGPPVTLDNAMAIARAVGAGKLLWGEASFRHDRPVIRAVLYDVANQKATAKEATVTLVAAEDDSLPVRFGALVDTLVASGQPRPPSGSPRRYAAVTAYAQGMAALSGWDLRLAQRYFRAALEAEPSYPAANVRFAQVSQWLRDPAPSWRAAASVATRSNELPPKERGHGAALLALANGDYPVACRRYAALESADSMDFAAAFGGGECRLQDRTVLPDPTSPSGWRFRSSRHAAARAYARAFDIAPPSYRAYREMIAYRLDRAFIARTGVFSSGVASDAQKGAFFAYPELRGDTIAFVPYPQSDFTGGTRRPDLSAHNAAIDLARRQVLDLVERWVEMQPTSIEAWTTRALALERAGIVAGRGQRSAIGSIRRARNHSRNLSDSVQAVRIQIRLLLKAGEFAAAAALSDTALRWWRNADDRTAAMLAPIAALRGNRVLAEALFERGAPHDSTAVTLDGRSIVAPTQVTVLALRLLAHAMLDGAVDTVALLERRIEQYVETLPAAERDATRAALMRNAAMVGFPRLGPRAVHGKPGGGYLIDFQTQIARGDTQAVRKGLLDLGQQRRAAGIPPGVLSVEAAYLEASLLAQIGERDGAIARLDDVLENLSAQSELISVNHRPASLVSAMLLRADLARATGQGSIEARWRKAVSDLRGRL